MSPDGTVVAGQGSTTDAENDGHALLWNVKDGPRAIPRLPGGVLRSQPRAVDNAGSVVGSLAFAQCPSRAFRWSRAGGAVLLDDLDGGDTMGGALDQSADGKVIVGWGASAAGLEATRWVDGKPEALADLPGGPMRSAAAVVSRDGTVIAGTGTNDRGRLAVLWTTAGAVEPIGDLDGGEQDSEPFGMSADGAVIVGRGNSARGPEGFRWTAKAGIEGLGDLDGGKFESIAFDVAADGRRVVGIAESTAGTEVFVWDEGVGMRSVHALLVAAGDKTVAGWKLTIVNACSDDGRVLVGGGTDPQGRSQGWIVELPHSPAKASLRVK